MSLSNRGSTGVHACTNGSERVPLLQLWRYIGRNHGLAQTRWNRERVLLSGPLDKSMYERSTEVWLSTFRGGMAGRPG